MVADVEVGSGRDSTQDVAWGPLVFEARRFVELRKKSLWQQFLSAESFGMGLFYTLNVSLLLTLFLYLLSQCGIRLDRTPLVNAWMPASNCP